MSAITLAGATNCKARQLYTHLYINRFISAEDLNPMSEVLVKGLVRGSCEAGKRVELDRAADRGSSPARPGLGLFPGIPVLTSGYIGNF